jgi:uncharacterized cysteine cluster protein YcgN (CxxCxxCC family)
MPDTDSPILGFERQPPSGGLEATTSPFWLTKGLQEMSRDEWESLCDGCGQCCLLKVEEEDTGKIYLTELSCRLLDTRTCRCRDYANRHMSVPDCIVISPNNTMQLSWLPSTCAYKRIANGRGLAWWHPLVSGDPNTVHQAGISVRGWTRTEAGVRPSAIAKYIVGEVV